MSDNLPYGDDFISSHPLGDSPDFDYVRLELPQFGDFPGSSDDAELPSMSHSISTLDSSSQGDLEDGSGLSQSPYEPVNILHWAYVDREFPPQPPSELASWWKESQAKIHATSAIYNFDTVPRGDSFGLPFVFDDGASKGVEAKTEVISSKDIRHNCSECLETFDTLYLLEDHAKTSGHLPFACTYDQCEKRYKRKDVCFRHMAKHKESSLLVCAVCRDEGVPKTFSRKDNLDTHIRKCHSARTIKSEPRSTGHRTTSPSLSESTISSISLETLMNDLPSEDQETYRKKRKRAYGEWTSEGTIRQSKTVRDIALGLREFLGEDDVAIRAIESRLDLSNESNTNELALSLAWLALVPPEDLPEKAKEQLRQTPLATRLDTVTSNNRNSKCGCQCACRPS